MYFQSDICLEIIIKIFDDYNFSLHISNDVLKEQHGEQHNPPK